MTFKKHSLIVWTIPINPIYVFPLQFQLSVSLEHCGGKKLKAVKRYNIL